MKNIQISLFLVLFSTFASAQQTGKLKLPNLSPEASFTQQLGTTEIKVAYARPLTRTRKIFGEVVPFASTN